MVYDIRRCILDNDFMNGIWFFVAVLTSLFKSKCKRCKKSCLEVERDIQTEIQEEKMELEFKNNEEELNKERNGDNV